MKIRHKGGDLSAHYQVSEESPNYYIVQNGRGEAWTFAKSDWEPVPIETWVDVTSDCRLSELNNCINHNGTGVAYCDESGRYRLRKVRLRGFDLSGDLHDYFIVEKRT